MDEVVLIKNPVFKKNLLPVRTEQVVALICDGGEAEISIDGEIHLIERTNFVVILHSQIIDALKTSEDFKCTIILLSGGFVNNLNIIDAYKFYKSVQFNPLMIINDSQYESLEHYIEMSRTMIGFSNLLPNAGEALRLLTKVFFLILGWSIHSDAVNYEIGLSDSDLVSKFIALVKKHFRFHRDVDFYADQLNISAKYLSSVVKRSSGVPPLKLIEDQVIIEAKSLLASSNKSIKEISEDLEFPTQSFFGRYFKRAVGVSPNAYRRSCK